MNKYGQSKKPCITLLQAAERPDCVNKGLDLFCEQILRKAIFALGDSTVPIATAQTKKPRTQL